MRKKRRKKHTLSKAPYPIASMALSKSFVKPSTKTSLFLFNQPSGAVMTTSSNSYLSPPSTCTSTFSPSCFLPLIAVTLVSSFTSAFSKAGFATYSKIFVYVPATKGFSPSIHSSNQKNFKLCAVVGLPT